MSRTLQTPAAEESRIAFWSHIARDDSAAADRMLERIDEKSRQYARQPEMGDARPDLGRDVRCFPVGRYVVIRFVTASR